MNEALKNLINEIELVNFELCFRKKNKQFERLNFKNFDYKQLKKLKKMYWKKIKKALKDDKQKQK